MDLNRITDREMATLENLKLFTVAGDGDAKWIAVPNYRFVNVDVPAYDWNAGDEVFIPRSPVPAPERTPDAVAEPTPPRLTAAER